MGTAVGIGDVEDTNTEVEIGAEKPVLFACNLCDRKCLTKQMLETHKLAHFYKFECDKCGKRVSTKYTLNNMFFNTFFSVLK